MDQKTVTTVGPPESLHRTRRTTRGRQSRRWLERLQPYLYLLPAALTIGVWIYVPLVRTFELSFFEWNLLPTSPRSYVGLENYQRLLELPELGRALLNTLIYTLGVFPMAVLLPLGVALLTDNIRGRSRDLYRALIFIPMIMAPVVVSVLWRWILAPSQGVLNVALGGLFDVGRINFLGNPQYAIWTVIFITGWKLLGFSTLIFSAGISNVNREYVEAAKLDGASSWSIVRFIILPLLSPTLLFMTMLSVLFASQWTFAYINVLTQGGPLQATTNIYYLLWQFGFGSFAVGWSSAAAVILFLGLGLLAFVFLRLMRRFSFYDS